MRSAAARILVTTAAVAAALIWWRGAPTFRLVNPQAYYLVLIGQAGERSDAGDYRAAHTLLAKAAELFPKRYEAYLSLGNLEAKRGDTNTALADYALALKYCGVTPNTPLSLKEQLIERAMIAEKVKVLRGAETKAEVVTNHGGH